MKNGIRVRLTKAISGGPIGSLGTVEGMAWDPGFDEVLDQLVRVRFDNDVNDLCTFVPKTHLCRLSAIELLGELV